MTPPRFVLGLGAASTGTAEDARALAEAVLAEAGIAADSLGGLATLDRRADHPALLALAHHLGLPLTGITPARLRDEETRLQTPSAAVARRTGVGGVAEAAALALAGEEARILVPKRIRGGITAALAGERS